MDSPKTPASGRIRRLMEGVTAEPAGVIAATCIAYLYARYVRLVSWSFLILIGGFVTLER
jgi:hypothetical protein